MKALLVDDERLARARLRKLLDAHPDVEIVGEADSVASARAALATHAPDLVFLDITMPGGSGFDLLAQERVTAAVIFVTAYDAHAIRAFDVGAVDYLLKPIEPARLAASLDRVRARAVAPVDRLGLTIAGALHVVPVADVILVEADGDYSSLVLRDGTRVTQKEPLASWEKRLAATHLRVSRSTLVALAAVAKFSRTDGSTYQLHLHGQAEPIAVSRSRGAAVKAALEATGRQR